MKRRLRRTIEDLRDLIIKILTSRVAVVGIIFAVLFAIISVRLFYLQIVRSEYYQTNFTQKSEKVIYSEGSRGNIYDCNGKLIAHNDISYSVVMTDEIPSSSTKGDTINKIVYDTINIIESNGDSITDNFNIEYYNGSVRFKENPVTAQITFLCNVFGLSSSKIYANGYDKYSAQEVLDYMCSDKKFDIKSDTYELEDRVKICTVRYAMSLNSYQKYIATEIASNISNETQAAILENSSSLTGVDIKETYKRVYDQGEYLGSILGYTGKISEDELDDYNYSNELNIEYMSNDIVGKTGIEKSFDEYLKGSRGTETVFVDSKGSIIDVVNSQEAKSGNDLYLSIDSDLQKACYEILEREIAGLLVAKIVNWDYESQGDDDIVYIPVKDVYYQLLTNVISIEDFSDKNASSREKNIYNVFTEKKEYVLNRIKELLTEDENIITGDLNSEYNEYMYYCYDILCDEKIIDKNIVDSSDEVYKAFSNETISFNDFLIHAISKNWINVSILNSENKYASSDEVYYAMIDKLLTILDDDQEFEEKIYYYMIYSEEISPYDICMLLYDQAILPEDDPYKNALEEGRISAYSYVISQISDLVITPAMIALDPCSGSIVITDTETGQIKAVVSYPSYDNNMLSGSIDSEYWNKLNSDKSSPLYNRATQALSAPGSTFKPITAAAGLNEHVITTDTYIYDYGKFEYVTPSPKCWVSPGSHGQVNVTGAISVSCNYFFYSVGYLLSLNDDDEYTSLQGLNILEKYATLLGLNDLSGIEITESSPEFSTTDAVRTSIGQGSSAFTTVQLARYANCLANKGDNYKLSLFDHITDKDDNEILSYSAVLTNKNKLDDSIWDAINAGLYSAVSVGSISSVFYDCPVQIAGKTGTAQESIYRSNHSNFIGYAPYNDPEIAFACTIRNGGSSTYAAEVAKKCVEYYYGYYSIDEITEQGAFEIQLESVTD